MLKPVIETQPLFKNKANKNPSKNFEGTYILVSQEKTLLGHLHHYLSKYTNCFGSNFSNNWYWQPTNVGIGPLGKKKFVLNLNANGPQFIIPGKSQHYKVFKVKDSKLEEQVKELATKESSSNKSVLCWHSLSLYWKPLSNSAFEKKRILLSTLPRS